MSKKKPNLSIKRKIAKEYVLGNSKRSELAENLVNLNSDASILDGKYIKQKTKSKYQEIDEYLVSNIVTLREKGGLISKNIV